MIKLNYFILLLLCMNVPTGGTSTHSTNSLAGDVSNVMSNGSNPDSDNLNLMIKSIFNKALESSIEADEVLESSPDPRESTNNMVTVRVTLLSGQCIEREFDQRKTVIEIKKYLFTENLFLDLLDEERPCTNSDLISTLTRTGEVITLTGIVNPERAQRANRLPHLSCREQRIAAINRLNDHLAGLARMQTVR